MTVTVWIHLFCLRKKSIFDYVQELEEGVWEKRRIVRDKISYTKLHTPFGVLFWVTALRKRSAYAFVRKRCLLKHQQWLSQGSHFVRNKFLTTPGGIEIFAGTITHHGQSYIDCTDDIKITMMHEIDHQQFSASP